MASGNTLFILRPQDSLPTATAYATLDTLAITGATPDSYIPVLDFDGAANEHADWFVVMPSYYAGGGLTFKAFYAVDTASGNNIVLDIRAITFAEDDALATARVIDTQTAVSTADTPINATANELSITGSMNLSHANAGSPAVGAYMQIRLTRNATDAGDTNASDVQLLSLYVTET